MEFEINAENEIILINNLYSLTKFQYSVFMHVVLAMERKTFRDIAKEHGYGMTSTRIAYVYKKAKMNLGIKQYTFPTLEDYRKAIFNNISRIKFIKKKEIYVVDEESLKKSKYLTINQQNPYKHITIPTEKSITDLSIDYLNIGVRTYNCLIMSNIVTIQDLVSKTEQDLLGIKNFGLKCLRQVIQALEENNLSLTKDQ